MNERLLRLTKVLESIPVDPRPVLTESDLSQICDSISEAAFDSGPFTWNEVTDNHLRYELCVHFRWDDLQEKYGG
jgi:hypothetical protein